jgi:hypothetical protein
VITRASVGPGTNQAISRHAERNKKIPRAAHARVRSTSRGLTRPCAGS